MQSCWLWTSRTRVEACRHQYIKKPFQFFVLSTTSIPSFITHFSVITLKMYNTWKIFFVFSVSRSTQLNKYLGVTPWGNIRLKRVLAVLFLCMSFGSSYNTSSAIFQDALHYKGKTIKIIKNSELSWIKYQRVKNKVVVTKQGQPNRLI